MSDLCVVEETCFNDGQTVQVNKQYLWCSTADRKQRPEKNSIRIRKPNSSFQSVIVSNWSFLFQIISCNTVDECAMRHATDYVMTVLCETFTVWLLFARSLKSTRSDATCCCVTRIFLYFLFFFFCPKCKHYTNLSASYRFMSPPHPRQKTTFNWTFLV